MHVDQVADFVVVEHIKNSDTYCAGRIDVSSHGLVFSVVGFEVDVDWLGSEDLFEGKWIGLFLLLTLVV